VPFAEHVPTSSGCARWHEYTQGRTYFIGVERAVPHSSNKLTNRPKTNIRDKGNGSQCNAGVRSWLVHGTGAARSNLLQSPTELGRWSLNGVAHLSNFATSNSFWEIALTPGHRSVTAAAPAPTFSRAKHAPIDIAANLTARTVRPNGTR
jgi:hypothetical protein